MEVTAAGEMGSREVSSIVLYAIVLVFGMADSREFRTENAIKENRFQIMSVCDVIRLCDEQRGENVIAVSVSGDRGNTLVQGELHRCRTRILVVGTQSLAQQSIMVPRRRGVPRRGGVLGISGREEAQARAIQPLAMVSPPSSPSEESDQHDSQMHTSSFTFRCRKNRSKVSLLITVIATEEEDDDSESQEDDAGELAQASMTQERAELSNDNPPPDAAHSDEHVRVMGQSQQTEFPPSSSQLMNEDAHIPDLDKNV